MASAPLTIVRNEILRQQPTIDSESLCSLSGVPPTRLRGIKYKHDARHLPTADHKVEVVSLLTAASPRTSTIGKVSSCDGGSLEVRVDV